MKWEKLGKIFDPAEHVLMGGKMEFAQSPQALVFEEFVRIYFSARKKDAVGKYLSHIQYVDMKKDLAGIIGVAPGPVIELGKLGCFDEHGIFPMNVLRNKGTIYAYTCGWSRRVSVPINMSIGHAVSRDNGKTFIKTGDGPVLTSSLNEPFMMGDPFVRVFGGVFHIWYIFGTEWTVFPGESAPDRVYKIGHAVSPDGIAWKKDGTQLISDRYNSESQALPTVIRIKDGYHMLFCYRQSSDFRKNSNRAYRLGYAHSADLLHWERDDKLAGIDVSDSGWDSEMLCYPNLFECGGKIYLLYNGNEFGRHGFGLAKLEE